MKKYNIYIHLKNIYIFFILLSLSIFFFSTAELKAKPFHIKNIEISKPFMLSFDKNEVINEGFKKAFFELIYLIINSSEQKKFKSTKLNEIKSMINSFTIEEEKFINDVYYVNLGVSFDKKKVFQYLETKNTFPSIPNKKKFLFIPIIIDEKINELSIFSNNQIFDNWNEENKSYYLIDYILPTEDLEDLDLLQSKYEFIEEYDFKEIINKYGLKESIVALIFKDKDGLRVLSRITIKNNVNLKNQLFKNVNIESDDQIKEVIEKLKTIYEDYWKNSNQINTSIKLILTLKVSNYDNKKISKFENILDETDFIYSYQISSFNKDHIYYKVIYNGTPKEFLNTMKEYNYTFDTQNKIWSLR